jgi:hypothetical protein
LHKRRNTPVKERILLGRIIPSLRTVDIIVTKIAAVPPTVHPTVMVVTDGLAATVEPPTDLRDVAMSARKRIADHGSIRTRNGQERRRPTRASLTTALRNASSSTLSTAKVTIVKT